MAVEIQNVEAASPAAAPAGRDPWQMVRWALLGAYLVGYVIYVWKVGLPIARIAVLISVAIPVILAQAGKPWRSVMRTLGDLGLYIAMWLAYDRSRGWADELDFPRQVQMPANIDKFLFFGNNPNTWMQEHFFHSGDVRWYDVVGSLTYFTHFLFPVLTAVILWVANRHQWVRYVRRFATVLFAGVATYIVMPTVPPWMASDPKYGYSLFPRLARHTGRGWSELHLKAVSKAFLKGAEWSNPTAALPSLHAAFALFVPLFFFAWVRAWKWRALMLCFPLTMGLSLVYFGEHYVTDIVLGWVYVLASFWFWGWWERSGVASLRTVRAMRNSATSATSETSAPNPGS
jgi:membrane-associated phospholipid phosphatase